MKKHPLVSRCLSMSGRRDSNPHASRRQILSLVRLPISPRPELLCITFISLKLSEACLFQGRKNRGMDGKFVAWLIDKLIS